MNKISCKISSFSKLATASAAVFAISLATSGRAWADPAAAEAGTLDDSRIVGRVLALNRAERRAADAVQGKLSPPAWLLAHRMRTEHASIDEKFRELAGPDATMPAPASDEAGSLSNLSGDSLQTAYAEREVNSHAAMLAALDLQLIPAAKDPQLRQRLGDLRSEVVSHLEQALAVRRAQTTLALQAEERAAISREIGNDVP